MLFIVSSALNKMVSRVNGAIMTQELVKSVPKRQGGPASTDSGAVSVGEAWFFSAAAVFTRRNLGEQLLGVTRRVLHQRARPRRFITGRVARLIRVSLDTLSELLVNPHF